MSKSIKIFLIVLSMCIGVAGGVLLRATILYHPPITAKAAATLREILVTFPEGSSIYKMGERLRQKGYQQVESFQALVKEGITADLRQRHWVTFKYVPSESLEGYLYPDTYWFFINASPEALAEIMVSRFEAVILSYWQQVNKETTYSLHEILTLASIIEKEAKQPKERPLIASVFYNRLRMGMPLAADPTIKYALKRPSKKVYYNQLEIDSLYNTYKRKGLPPGPICNPGIESFKAAVHPTKTDYFFFVAKKDGDHVFSRTWAEHQKAINFTR
ncbi:endolytic transglycosylase MltG [Candidatus Saganbacteria bacterium]|nr:endolytic transglycosylase MltG [Candidatus Saganbacteria bacterium]